MRARAISAVHLLLLLSLSHSPPCTMAGKILVWPADFSHWFNINVIIEELVARGHNVTVVTHSATSSVKTEQSQGYNVEIIQVPYTKQDVFNNLDTMFKYWVNEVPNDNLIQGFLKIKEIIDQTTYKNQVLCRELFAREDLLEKWRKERFDVVLTDPMYMCRSLLPLKLNLPFIVSLRFSFGNSMERLCGQLPTPASYVPAVSLGYKHHMDFLQRLKNVLFNFFQDFLFVFLNALKWDPFYTEVMGSKYTKQDVINNLENFIQYWIYDVQHDNIIQTLLKIKEIVDETTEQNHALCRELFGREDLLEKWRKEQFEVLLTDPMLMCGDLLALKLNLPLIISLRFSFGSSMERLCGQLPTPASYVPAVSLSYTDQMDFPQRVKNVLFNLFQNFLFTLLTTLKWDPLYTECMGKILIWPAEFSHGLNLKSIIDELIARGHSVTVVTHSATPSIKTEQSPGYSVIAR
ncbi:hypothetical protein KOW79_022159 [Hemibagrus wyckioides]|uniref:UDP-glucuronosyltransferase n=1 Tax=Hemibagrus wyckioides TaxID=337641 RepID=A0A9D3S856_9TELE|nr:hypothetical protein KOW79_022159 [Hemibagrus wyckioides]